MQKTPDSTIPDLAQVQRTTAQLKAEIELLKQLPEKLRKEQEELRNTLPPTDILTHKIRQQEHEINVARGEIKNLKREATRHTWVLLLLLIATASMLWWAYQSMLRHGVL